MFLAGAGSTSRSHLHSRAHAAADSFGLPRTLVWSNYADVLTSLTFWQELLNSTTVMVATAAGVVVLAAMPAFVFARIQFRGRGLIVPQVAFGLPGSILILRNFFANVPKELEEAAALDGITTIGFFWRIMLPLVRPALAAVVVLAMVGSWNAFFLPLLVLNNTSLWTLPLGIMQFQGHGPHGRRREGLEVRPTSPFRSSRSRPNFSYQVYPGKAATEIPRHSAPFRPPSQGTQQQ